MKSKFLTLSKSIVIYGVGIAFNQLMNVLLLPVFTRYMTAEEYGIIGILNTVLFISGSLFLLGINVSCPILYFSSQDKHEKYSTINTAVRVLAISGILLIIAGAIAIPFFGKFLFPDTRYVWCLLIFLAQACLANIIIPMESKLQYESKALQFSGITLTGALAYFICAFVLVVKFKMGIWGISIAGLVSKIVLLILFSASAREVFSAAFSREKAIKLIKLGVPIVPAVFSLYLLQQGNPFILSKTQGLKQAGLYTAGANLGMIIQLLISGFSTAWVPFFLTYKPNPESGKDIIFLIYKYFIFVLAFVAALFFPFSGIIASIFLGPSFYDSHRVIPFIAVAYFISGIFTLILPPLYFKEKTYLVAIFQMISCVIFIPLSFFFSSIYGITGAAFSLIVGNALISLLLMLFYRINSSRFLQINYTHWLPLLFLFCYLATIFLILIADRLLIPKPVLFAILLALPVLAFVLSFRKQELKLLTGLK